MAESLKILLVSSECAPFAKTGGLADVVAALPKALTHSGHDVRVVMPFYRQVAKGDFSIGGIEQQVTLGPAGLQEGMPNNFGLRQGVLSGTSVPVYFIDQPTYYDRVGLYGDAQGDYADNVDRYIFFARATLALAKAIKFQPDVVHCNDWHSGLLPVYLRTTFKEDPFFEKTGSLMTVHNLAYQGLFPDQAFSRCGLDWSLFNAEALEFYGQLNFMKGGLSFADRLNTVSPRYAEEIKTPEFGCGLEGVMRRRSADLSGIINGVDIDVWDPAKDAYLPLSYHAGALDNKEALKHKIIKELGLPAMPGAALVGMVTRLDNMKGLSLVEEVMDYMMHLDLQFVLLGSGEPKYHEYFKKLVEMYPERASVHLVYNDELAHKIEAASDIFLMPSRFEPCGLNQLISLRYGTVPVVRAVGGLADTIKEADLKAGTGNGFVFHEYNSMALFNAIKRALAAYGDKSAWRQLQGRGMAEDHSWSASAKKYEALYRDIVAIRSHS